MIRVQRLIVTSMLFMLVTACSGAKQTYINPNFEAYDKHKTVRVAMYVLQNDFDTHQEGYKSKKFKFSAPKKSEKVLSMWAIMAQQYLNDKRDYFVTHRSLVRAKTEIRCRPPLQGYWLIDGDYHHTSDPNTLFIQLNISLKRCDHIQVWAGQVKGEWPTQDQVLVDLRQGYIKRLGSDVGDVATPSFYAIQQLLTLTPLPKLGEKDTEDKIMWEDDE